MRGKRTWALLVGLALVFAACSDSTPTSTLAPGTTAPATTASTTTEAPTTTSSTTTTTTQSPDERLAEIQALVEEAFFGRTLAIYEKDPSSLLSWAGSQSSYDNGLEAMDRTVYIQEPAPNNTTIIIDELLLDRPDCIVTRDTVTVAEGVIEGVVGPSTTIKVWWPGEGGRLLHGAIWQDGTPQFQWIEECDIAVRGVTP